MIQLRRLACVTFVLALVTSFAFAADPSEKPEAAANGADDAAAPAEPKLDMAKLEANFAKTMSGVTLVGYSTRGDEGDAAQPKPDRYTIVKVTKSKGDLWVFNARVQFGSKDVTLPFLVPVKWAGDTPVISVTNMGFPGLGTYSARVVIYDDHYAGTWSGKDHGGQLWGKIERTKNEDTSAGKEKEQPSKEDAAK